MKTKVALLMALSVAFSCAFSLVAGQETEPALPELNLNNAARVWYSKINEQYSLKFDVTHNPKQILMEDPVKGPRAYWYFTYTLANDTGVIVPPGLIQENELLAADVLDINGVRLFKSGYKLTPADIRILRRVTLRPIYVNNERKPASSFKVGDSLPDDVLDFDNNVAIPKGTVLDERTASILLRVPLRPIYLQRPVSPQLDVRIFVNPSNTMKCLPGCDEEFDISSAFPGTKFKCGAKDEELAKLGVKRITKNSIYNRQDGVLGCTNEISVAGIEYPEIVNEEAEQFIWNNEEKVCQFCQTRFNVQTIKHFLSATIQCPLCGKSFDDDFSLHRLSDQITCPLCEKSFKGSDVLSVEPYRIECPACGQMLRKDMNFVELSEPRVFGKNLRQIAFGETVRGIAVFNRLSPEMHRMDILVSGLTTQYFVEDETGTITPLRGDTAKGIPTDRIRIPVLNLYYRKLGDEFRPDLDFLDYKGKKWTYNAFPVKVNRGEAETAVPEAK